MVDENEKCVEIQLRNNVQRQSWLMMRFVIIVKMNCMYCPSVISANPLQNTNLTMNLN